MRTKEQIKRIAELNECLFDAEFTLERMQLNVEATRNYFAADPYNQDKLANLHNAVVNYNWQKDYVERVRKEFEQELLKED